jgi:hypothetical protein
MRICGPAHSLFLCRGMLGLAALLVPGKGRPEWLQEWRAELWHVWHTCKGNGGSAASHRQREIVAFTLGAFQDAFWLWRDHSSALPRRLFRPGTPSRCILVFSIAIAACLLVAYCRPGVWSMVRPYPYRDAAEMVMIARGGFESTSSPTIEFSEYQSWRQNSGHLFTGLAFYQLVTKSIDAGTGSAPVLPIARASANLFELLGIPISSAVSPAATRYSTRMFLKRSIWLKYFGADSHLFGRSLWVDGQQVILAGIVEDEYWRLPGKTDAWLLEDDKHLSALQPDAEGYVLAHAAPSVFPGDGDGRRRMYAARKDGSYDWFACESLSQRTRQPFSVFLFALLLACLALPATTSLPLGDYPVNSNHVPWTTRVRRWAFLALKFVLIVPLVYFASFDLAYASSSLSVDAPELIELSSAFCGLLFAFRWALRDQRKRCPVCLRTLTNPARVGQFSRNFLAWNGTELVCLSGHGLLHVPDLSTSWFGSQRWLYLDPSWTGLFPVGT